MYILSLWAWADYKMKKYPSYFVCLSAVLIFLSLSCMSASDSKAQDFKVTPAPDFQLPDTQRNTVILSSYAGKQPVLLFFWTTWCPYCRKELKMLNEKYAQLKKDGMEALAINVGERSYRVENFIKSYNLTYKVLLDKDGTTIEAFGVFGVPTYVGIDKKGNQRFMVHSFPEDEYKTSLLE